MFVCRNSVFLLLILLHKSSHLDSPVCILSYSTVFLLLLLSLLLLLFLLFSFFSSSSFSSFSSPSSCSSLLLLLCWHYSQMRTFASLTAFSQSALLFDLSFRFVTSHLFISVCTKFHHLSLSPLPSRLPRGLLLKTPRPDRFTPVKDPVPVV